MRSRASAIRTMCTASSSVAAERFTETRRSRLRASKSVAIPSNSAPATNSWKAEKFDNGICGIASAVLTSIISSFFAGLLITLGLVGGRPTGSTDYMRAEMVWLQCILFLLHALLYVGVLAGGAPHSF